MHFIQEINCDENWYLTSTKQNKTKQNKTKQNKTKKGKSLIFVRTG
jgi:hypothetical protein